MKKVIFLYLVIILTLILLFGSFSYAVGNASTYKITVQSIQLKNSVTNNWVTISQPNREINIAAVGVGAVAGTLIADSLIPEGTYDNFKIVLSESIKFSGVDGVNYTKDGGTITVTGSDANAASTATWAAFPPNATLVEGTESHTATAGEQGEVIATLDLDTGDADNYFEVYATNDLGTAMTVTKNSRVSMSFDFDTKSTIIYNNGGGLNNMMFFTPPQEGTRFEITVDGTTSTITESDMRIDF